MQKKIFIVAATFALVLGGASVLLWAALTPEEIARLGADLTPVGAEKAGNAAGTIPPWEGGITTWPEGYEPGDHHPDPFADDPILFTITGQNADELRTSSPRARWRCSRPTTRTR